MTDATEALAAGIPDDVPGGVTGSPGEPVTRCGYVTIAGRPNAGKSTLLNALVGEKLSIVSPRAQTTWERVTGIRTAGGVQMIFLDTPGLLDARDLHQKSMRAAAHEALKEADVVLFVVDASREREEVISEPVVEALAETRAPVVVALNKIDTVDAGFVQRHAQWFQARLGAVPIPVSATRGEGLDALVRALEEALPEGPFLYPEEDLALQSVRFFVAELVRETVFEQFEDEIPYAVATRVEEFREDQDPLYISVVVHVERESQKGIVVGKGGHAIRRLGMASRRKIETFLGRPVYLDLWVKPLKGWRRKRHHLQRLGYRVPDEEP
ncbi:MAG: GTPase Era [Gemmatimonadales bacterium]|jgi:GTP-binding protein Era|nr:MAG: GTPase Era [Gemmatimonadales bacterium]